MDPIKITQLDVVENDARELLVTGRVKLGVNITSPIKVNTFELIRVNT